MSASNEDATDTYVAWKVFDDGTGSIPQVGWYSDERGNYNGTNGTVTTTSTVRLAPETEKGEWLQLEFPYLFHFSPVLLFLRFLLLPFLPFLRFRLLPCLPFLHPRLLHVNLSCFPLSDIFLRSLLFLLLPFLPSRTFPSLTLFTFLTFPPPSVLLSFPSLTLVPVLRALLLLCYCS